MLSIIIPTYNEKENLSSLFAQIISTLKGIDFELILVDDNSPDETAEFATFLSKTYKFVRVLKRPGKLGLASAIKDGVAISKGDLILVMDADLSHPPQMIRTFLERLKSNDIVLGSRLIEGGEVKNWPIHRKIISKGADTLAKLLLNVKVSDPMSGFFLIRKTIFEKSRIRVTGYKILLNLLYDNPKAKVVEIPYIFKDRFRGQTKLGFGETVNYVFDLCRIVFS